MIMESKEKHVKVMKELLNVLVEYDLTIDRICTFREEELEVTNPGNCEGGGTLTIRAKMDPVNC